MKRPTQIRLLAVSAVALLLAAGVAVLATAKPPDPLKNAWSYVAPSVEVTTLLTDAESGTPVSAHEHAADGSAVGATFGFTEPTVLRSFSLAPAAPPPLHTTPNGCPHGYGLMNNVQIPWNNYQVGTACVWDVWHGTPCSVALEMKEPFREECDRHRAKYGSQAPWPKPSNVDFVVPKGRGGGATSYCDPQTRSDYCTSTDSGWSPPTSSPTSPSGPVRAGDVGCSSGMCDLSVKIRVNVTAKNLADDIALVVSMASTSTRLAPQTHEVRLPQAGGGSGPLEFLWKGVPARDLRGISFTAHAQATSVDLSGKEVQGDASDTVTPILPDGSITIRISPATVAGLAYAEDGSRILWQKQLAPQLRHEE